MRWIRSVAGALAETHLLGLAAQMAFWLFLSLVPLAAVGGLVTARLLQSRTWLLGSMLGAVPPSARDLVRDQLARVAAWHGSVGPVAIATFAWLASSGVHAVFDALEEQTDAAPRPWWKKRLLALATCAALSVGVAVLALLATGLDWVGSVADGGALHGITASVRAGVAGRIVRLVVGLAIGLAMVAGLYRVGIPRDARARCAVLPGAVLAVVLQAILGGAYGFYVARFGGGGAYQAGLAVVGITMTTLWLFGIALLLGAQLNLVVAEGRRTPPPPHSRRTTTDEPRGRAAVGKPLAST